MKKSIICLFVALFSLPLFSQEDDFIAQSIANFEKAQSLNEFNAYILTDDDDLILNQIAYDQSLDKIALERAELLVKEPLDKNSWRYYNEYDYNFWSTEIPINENGEKEFAENDSLYFLYASIEWSRIDIDTESEFYEENDNIIEEWDIHDLMNVIRSKNVGFAVTKTDTHVYVVAYFEKF